MFQGPLELMYIFSCDTLAKLYQNAAFFELSGATFEEFVSFLVTRLTQDNCAVVSSDS